MKAFKLKLKNKKIDQKTIGVKKKFINKKSVLSLVVFVICLTCIGIYIKNISFGKEDNNIIDNIKVMQSYKTKVNITVKNDKQEILYCGQQIYKSSKGSKMTLEKNKYMIKDGKLLVQDQNGKRYEENKEDALYRLSFIEEYLRYIYIDNKIDHKEKTYDGIPCEVFSFELIGNNDNIYKAKMFFDKKTSNPIEIKIYNKKGQETINIKYAEFIRNLKIDDNEFKE